ncbi:MAG: lasso peptide biosynthesis B2 protein [Actinomycetota bacterium]
MTCNQAVRGLRQLIRARRAFRRRGLTASVPRWSLQGDDRSRTIPEARRMAWRWTVVTRQLFGSQRCVDEAVCVTAALRAIGIPAQLTVGCAAVDLGTSPTGVHAWVSLGPHPITDMHVVETHIEMARWPS